MAEDQWKEQKDFMKKIAEGFQIQEDGTHAGVLAYSTIPSISMKLGERNARQELDKALDDLPRDPGNRNLVRNLFSTLRVFPTERFFFGRFQGFDVPQYIQQCHVILV